MSKQRLVECLCELFVEIDISGDDSLVWEEFTAFIIDNGMIERDTSLVNRIKSYYRAELPPKIPQRLHEQKAVEQAISLGKPIERLAVIENGILFVT
jgi:hypothetical protein